jgi:hypothetical protein
MSKDDGGRMKAEKGRRFKPYPAYMDGRQDDKGVTHAVLKTIAAFLNAEGGCLTAGRRGYHHKLNFQSE